MYERILVPTDGSEATAAATDQAVDLAAQFGAVLDALYVVDERFATTEYDLVVEELEAVGEAALERVRDTAQSRGVDVELHIRRGVPHEEIVDAVAAYDADVVVMGTHGRTGFDRIASLGSTTARVVRRASVPVLAVPAPRNE